MPLLPGVATDPNYTLTGNPNGGSPPSAAYVVDPLITAWMPNDGVSQWISPTVSGDAVAGTYTYKTPFSLDCDHGLTIITGQWASTMMEPSTSTRPTAPLSPVLLSDTTDFTQWYPFTFTGGLSAGQHSLIFVVTNIADAQPTNPAGLRVEVKGSVSCCVNCSPTNTISLNTGADHVSGALYNIGDEDA